MSRYITVAKPPREKGILLVLTINWENYYVSGKVFWFLFLSCECMILLQIYRRDGTKAFNVGGGDFHWGRGWLDKALKAFSPFSRIWTLGREFMLYCLKYYKCIRKNNANIKNFPRQWRKKMVNDKYSNTVSIATKVIVLLKSDYESSKPAKSGLSSVIIWKKIISNHFQI